MMNVQEKLHRALANQQAGLLAEAAATYEEILRFDASHPDALHLLGLIESKKGNHDQAIDLIQQAVSAVPTNPVMLSNLGVVLRYAGKIEAAIEAYRKSIALDPTNADAHFNLGKSLKLSGELIEAETFFRNAISLAPKRASPWLSLMTIYADRDLEAALAIGQQALRYCPNSAEVQMSVGALCRRCNKTAEAIQHYRQAVELAPRKVDALCRLASTLISEHDLDEGQKYLVLAQAIEPESVHVLNSLGLLHNTLGNSTAAIQVFRRAIELYPSYGTAHSNLSSALRKQGCTSEALACVQRGLELEPKNIESRVIEGGALMALGRLDEADASFRSAIEAKKGYKDAHDSLLMCQHYRLQTTPESLFREHRLWDQRYARPLYTDPQFEQPLTIERPLRIGFASGDLGNHPVGYFAVSLLEAIDRQRFPTYVYSDRIGRDSLASRIEKSVDAWLDTASISDEQLARRIRQDRIDILFDLAGHTAQNRLLVFARRVAPVQMTWAGYVGTTGMTQMDYLVADRFHVPEGSEKYYSERVLRMPHGYVTYLPPDDAPEVTPLPALANGYVTFASMCNPSKVNAEVVELWGRILMRVPNSRLMLCYSGWNDVGNRQRVEQKLALMGCANRVDFDQKSGAAALMELYGKADLALDTLPYSGGLTTCEALWMGVPVVTWPGEWFAGRHSLSHLSNVGLEDFVATDAEDYLERAVRWSSQLVELSNLRSSLRARMAASPLCDGKRFAQDFSELMLSAWEERCKLRREQ